MARPALIEKLDRELREPIETERQVVYILVELRKLMERNSDAESYFALNFYWDWAVHTKLDRNGAARIVERFDKYQALIEVSQSSPEGTVPEADFGVLKDVEDTVRLQRFRTQFRQYLEQNGLPSDVVRDDMQWTNFLSYYFRVIEDCALICKAELDHVREVSVTVIETKTGIHAQLGGYSVMVAWEWQPRKSPIFMRHVSTF
jgi:hypothetical protein